MLDIRQPSVLAAGYSVGCEIRSKPLAHARRDGLCRWTMLGSAGLGLNSETQERQYMIAAMNDFERLRSRK